MAVPAVQPSSTAPICVRGALQRYADHVGATWPREQEESLSIYKHTGFSLGCGLHLVLSVWACMCFLQCLCGTWRNPVAARVPLYPFPARGQHPLSFGHGTLSFRLPLFQPREARLPRVFVFPWLKALQKAPPQDLVAIGLGAVQMARQVESRSGCVCA